MMLEVVLLELLVVRRETRSMLAWIHCTRDILNLLAVVQEVMGEIIANIPEDTATEYRHSRVPVVIEDRMCQLPERSS